MNTTTNAQGVEIGPDGKEWAITEAGYAHVHAALPRAIVHNGIPTWHGWALREAFVAGAEWQIARAQPKLKVVIMKFPESNGKTNWTALLMREESFDGLIGNCGGISLARGELWNRVAYEAECTKYLIGLRDTEPFILDYGDDIKTPEEWGGERGRVYPKPVNLEIKGA